MDKKEIGALVNDKLKDWMQSNEQIGRYYSLSDKARDFIIEVIDNIKADPSPNWNIRGREFENGQRYAISLIPEAFNQISSPRYFKYRADLENKQKITTWEIWQSLSDILQNRCFISRSV
ncbi:MAG: hypothetical protein CMI36_02525 [Owenweeksia sp.]|nr:hypothetical protein [Owenweeksia sp.]MBF97841.1 hypothetical protein [Owenweeksia sp.]HBF21575.1 hypothetical protein [Cryomorphaceae bacterium]HCQ15796.1 hypothetical protein [Cryomorphaceae bacterium]|tara:strand:- start:463 stop:822 length:360 start_codon:yes stop_codon:yes gene_type:complete